MHFGDWMKVRGQRIFSKKDSQTVREELSLNGFDLWALGMTIVIGGQFFGWNSGLEMGFGSFLIAFFLVSCGYTILTFSLAELSGVVPFGGGSYAYVRLCLGNYIGFLVGCFEALGLILYTSSGTRFFGEMITDIFHTDKKYEPLYWIVAYLVSVLICIKGGRSFWYVNRILAVISVLVIILYIFSSLPFVNFEKRSDVRWFVGGGNSFLNNLHHLIWFFIGIEFVSNGTKDCNNPLSTVHFGYVSGIVTLIVTSICILFISISLQSWESLSEELSPLSMGFSRAFSSSSRLGLILSLPAVFATNFGFIFAFGRILYSLGQANLLPSVLGRRWISNSTPDIALMLGSLLGFGFNCLYQYGPFPKPDLFHLCALASCFTYCSLLASYIMFSTNFGHLTRSFQSVFGITGAVFGIFIFGMVWISIAAFQHTSTPIYYFLGVWFVLTVYYFAVVRHHQYFCTEEQEVLFKTYVAKFNSKKRPSAIHRFMTSIPTSINRVLPVTPKNDASFSNSQGGTVTVQTNTAHTSSGHNAAAVQESSRNNNLSSPVFSDSTTRYRIVVVEERDTDCPDIEQQAKFTDFPQPEECCSHVSQSLVLK